MQQFSSVLAAAAAVFVTEVAETSASDSGVAQSLPLLLLLLVSLQLLLYSVASIDVCKEE